jgi:hypothetical protein
MIGVTVMFPPVAGIMSPAEIAATARLARAAVKKALMGPPG